MRGRIPKLKTFGGTIAEFAKLEKYKAHQNVGKSLPFFPESGSAPHPAMTKQFNLDRSTWRTQRYEPANCGVYEMLSDGQIKYAHWNGHSWTMNGSTAPRRAKWRGLAYDPDLPCVTYSDPPGALLPGMTTGGYVEHDDPSSPRVRLIHVAKVVHSKDGGLLTVCGHVSRSRTPLRLWCDSLQIKTIDGYRPELCSVCTSRTFDTTTVWSEPTSAKAVDIHAQPTFDKPQQASVDHNTEDGSMNHRETVPQPPPVPEHLELPGLLAERTRDLDAAKAASTRKICFAGGIGYENWHTGSRAKKFELLDKDHVAIELISKVDEPGMPPTVLRTVASRDWWNVFSTGMVRLTTPDGNHHPYGKAAFSFTIVHLDQEIVKIEGHWKDEDGTVYPFVSILQHAVEPLR